MVLVVLLVVSVSVWVLVTEEAFLLLLLLLFRRAPCNEQRFTTPLLPLLRMIRGEGCLWLLFFFLFSLCCGGRVGGRSSADKIFSTMRAFARGGGGREGGWIRIFMGGGVIYKSSPGLLSFVLSLVGAGVF